jgi:hypothetical protein
LGKADKVLNMIEKEGTFKSQQSAFQFSTLAASNIKIVRSFSFEIRVPDNVVVDVDKEKIKFFE